MLAAQGAVAEAPKLADVFGDHMVIQRDAPVILFGSALPVAEWIGIPLAAFLSTLTACALVYALSRWRGAGAEMLALAGIAVLIICLCVGRRIIRQEAAPFYIERLKLLGGYRNDPSRDTDLACTMLRDPVHDLTHCYALIFRTLHH